MFAWLGALRPQRSAPEEGTTPMADQAYWDMVLQNIADMRTWLAQVEQNVAHARVHAEPTAPKLSVDEEIAAADSPTRVQKALEREYHVDRRTIYQRVERVVEAHQLHRKVPNWRENLEFWKYMAQRTGDMRRFDAALAALAAKEVAA